MPRIVAWCLPVCFTAGVLGALPAISLADDLVPGIDKLLVDGGLVSRDKNLFTRREHVMRQLTGSALPQSFPADLQWISEPWENRTWCTCPRRIGY